MQNAVQKGRMVAYVDGMAPANADFRALAMGRLMSGRAREGRFPFKAPHLDEGYLANSLRDAPISQMKPERLIICLMGGKTEHNGQIPPEKYVAMLAQLFRLSSNGKAAEVEAGLRLQRLDAASFLEKHVKPKLREIAMEMDLPAVIYRYNPEFEKRFQFIVNGHERSPFHEGFVP